MAVICRRVVLGLVLLAGLSPRLIAQSAPAPARAFTPVEMEAFLLNARIGQQRDAGGGVTGSTRVTLSDGRLTHDAHVQIVDIAKPVFEAGRNTELNFKDTYRYNIAGYRVAQLLGLETIPMSVERYVDGKKAAITWWVDDVMMTERDRLKSKSPQGPDPGRTGRQMQIMRIFDELIQNRDRNQGNILWTSDWTMWLIDHTRAFRLGKDLVKPESLLRCDRTLLERLRTLTPESLASAVGSSLTKEEQSALLGRRDRIVKIYDDRIVRVGETNVLFTL